jgi:CRISPR-associated protein Cas2
MYVVVCYDIEKDRKRKKIYDTLVDFGLLPVQKSVFEGKIKRDKLSELKKKLIKLMVKKTDSIRYYTICKACQKKTLVQGIDMTPEYKATVVD